MIEALDLLLEAKDRSSKKEVKQVKPTHADVGAEITAEISTGPYRFVYRKRFHKRCETELTVLAPRREQLTGDEAHDRVRAMLDETVDTWSVAGAAGAAVRVRPRRWTCPGVTRCRARSTWPPVRPSQLSGAEPLLIDRIEAEYLRYFTRTGRPTAEWAAATNRLRAADDELAQLRGRRRGGRRRGAAARARSPKTSPGWPPNARMSSKRLAAAQAAADAVAALSRPAQGGRAGRRRRGRRAHRLGCCGHRTAPAAGRHRRAGRRDREAGSRGRRGRRRAGHRRRGAGGGRRRGRGSAVGGRQPAQARVEAARRAVDQLADRDEADRLAARLAKIAAAQRDLDRVDAELAGIALTDEGMRAIEAAEVGGRCGDGSGRAGVGPYRVRRDR